MTLNAITEETLGFLRGYTRVSEQTTHLTSGINTTALTFTVNDASQVSRGMAEIGDELVWIDSVDKTTNTITLAPYGRGYAATTAASHASGDKLTYTPIFPRYRVKQEINDTIRSLNGYLTGDGSTTFPFVAARAGYELPASTYDVLRVEWAPPGPTKSYQPVRKWRFNKHADTDLFPSGKALEIWDGIVPGRTVQVWYTMTPNVLANDTDPFAATTGLPESCRDVIKLGAAARLLGSVDPARLNTYSMQANALDSKVQVGSGDQVARYVYALFVQRRDEERARQLRERPISVHYTR